MKRYFVVLFVFCAIVLSSCQHSLTHYVNPMVGTDGYGHTYPGAIVPFGMIQPGPDTRLNGWDGCSGYHYSDDTLYGFSHTHLSGTGCEDYGDVLIMPFTDSAQIDRNDYRSAFSHQREEAIPGYYSVILDKNRVLAELTATQRTAVHRYTFPYSGDKGVVIDLTHRDKTLSCGIRKEGSILTGWRFSSAWNPEQKLFFAIDLGEDVDHVVFYCDDQVVDDTSIDGENCKVVVYFPANSKEKELHVAISGVDEEGAILNLKTDKGISFAQAKKEAQATWETELGKITVEAKDRKAMKNFYTALYHCMTSPYLYSDVDGRYRGMDDSIHVADEGRNIYTVFSLWDTYRALHPLLTLIDRERTADFIYTFAKQYEQGGELTMWELSSHETHCMIGYHACPVILEAMQAGLLDECDNNFKHLLLEAMVATSNRSDAHVSYGTTGYLTSEVDNESVSKTLEYAFDDWCIARYASWLKQSISESDTLGGSNLDDVIREYGRRSQSWSNIMDENGFMHARRNGGFVSPFSPSEVNNHFTEANSWQYSTYVVHDLKSYFSMMGGNTRMEAFLDTLFHTNAKLEGRDQVDISGLIGLYAHGNEPSHHAAYLYAYLGKQDKTAELVRQVCNELYSPDPDGLCGNEDCGQMSAWYVMSSLGFYPVCPGSGVYVIGSPLFSKACIHLENGKTIDIVCEHQGSRNAYIQQASLQDTALTQPFLHYSDLTEGAQLHFIMGGSPVAALHQLEGDIFAPYALDSVAARDFCTMPYFSRWEQRFDGIASLTLRSLNADSIYYSINGGEWICFHDVFTIDADAVIRAYATKGNLRSMVVTQQLTRFEADKKLTYVSEPADQYRDSGEEGLIDRMCGEKNYRIGGWQGWQTDMEVIIDLLEPRSFSGVSLFCLSDCRSWIFLPSDIYVEVSDDGVNFEPFTSRKNIAKELYAQAEGAVDWNYQLDAKTYEISVSQNRSVTKRYVRIVASNYGPMPHWHVSAGEQAWLFCSEITTL